LFYRLKYEMLRVAQHDTCEITPIAPQPRSAVEGDKMPRASEGSSTERFSCEQVDQFWDEASASGDTQFSNRDWQFEAPWPGAAGIQI
jgi:hypothetical protein